MALVSNDTAELVLLNYLLKTTTPSDNLKLNLFQNDFTPSSTDTNGNYTACNFGGYQEFSISRAGWEDATTNGSGKAQIVYGTPLSWTVTSGTNTVYGFWIRRTSDLQPFFAERFATPRTVTTADQISLTPKITLDSEA